MFLILKKNILLKVITWFYFQEVNTCCIICNIRSNDWVRPQYKNQENLMCAEPLKS